jgi:hypothetical protein
MCYTAGEIRKRVGVVYLIKVSGYSYIGETIQDLEERLRKHVYEVFDNKPKSGWSGELPFVEPFKNYKGLTPVLRRTMMTHRDWEQLKSQPLKNQRQWLLKKVIANTVVVDSCWCYQKYEVRKASKKGRWTTDKTNLLKKEKNWIRKCWVEDPRKLLNYKGRPNHSLFAYQLKGAMEVDALRYGYEDVDELPDTTRMAIKNNRRSEYRLELAKINKELKLLNNGSKAQRRTYLRCLIWKKEAEDRASSLWCDF